MRKRSGRHSELTYIRGSRQTAERVALDIRDQALDIWTWDFARETLTQITFDPAPDQFPIWTPDGARLVFTSFREGGVTKLFSQSADGTGTERLLRTKHPASQFDFSGWQTAGVSRESGSTGPDLMVVALDGDRPARPRQAPLDEQNGEIVPKATGSPTSRTNRARTKCTCGLSRTPARASGGSSTGGGTRPLWARNGKELFYVAPTGSLMGVGLELGANVVPAIPQTVEGRYFMGWRGKRGRPDRGWSGPSVRCVA